MRLTECNHVITNTKGMLQELKDLNVITGAEMQDLLILIVGEIIKREAVEYLPEEPEE